ncbi:alkaline phosphatase family protein [Roseomonas elaeocarpi]|uniref:Alkaline phosphatase family protein n=1 Tax=Roseomonas elaeocarpi TaxID=907779 RepID=A0ABV6JMK2_9PROT
MSDQRDYSSAARPRRVLVVLFDGLRPDVVTAERMPTLHRFLEGARRFTEASSVFPSITRVCATAIGTGAPPAVNGIIHNGFPDPAAREGRFLDTALADDMRRGAAHHGAAFTATPRFADALAGAGRRFALVHSGSSGGAYLLDPRARDNGSAVFSVLGRDQTETPDTWDLVVERLGPPPTAPADKLPFLRYAGQAMAEVLIPELQPDVAFLWLTEPDWSFHYRGMDTPATAEAMRLADEAFARTLAAIRRLPGGEDTAVITMSDHGHVGTTESFDLVAALRELGFEATLDRPGADLSVAAGTLCWLWPTERDEARLGRLAAALQEMPWCGMLLSDGGNGLEGRFPGTFDLALVNADHPRSAPLLVGMRGGPGPDLFGLPGSSPLVGKDLARGGGMHGGLHRREMANLIALAAPGVSAGEDVSPVGLIDIGPTILGLLGIAAPASMVGRDITNPALSPRSSRTVEVGYGSYRQRLTLAGEGRGTILRDGERIA